MTKMINLLPTLALLAMGLTGLERAPVSPQRSSAILGILPIL